ncbi:MAG TPA: hypothetical protein VMD74_02660 [Candidatus Methylomirabilis sp.]|nr:hypothetical protein [Candidatus Methylomirabilis sp.]
MITIPKTIFIENLRRLSSLNAQVDRLKLFNSFTEYFADWLENNWSGNFISASCYFRLIGRAIEHLHKEKERDFPDNDNLRILIRGDEGTDRLIVDYFLRGYEMMILGGSEFRTDFIKYLIS